MQFRTPNSQYKNSIFLNSSTIELIAFGGGVLYSCIEYSRYSSITFGLFYMNPKAFTSPVEIEEKKALHATLNMFWNLLEFFKGEMKRQIMDIFLEQVL